MFFYRLLIFLLTPLLATYIAWQSIKGKSTQYFCQRLGFKYSALPKNSLWFHCASVGEVITLLPLLKNLHCKKPALKFIITTNTITGEKIVAQQKLDYLFHSYLPFDWTGAVLRFIKTSQPKTLFVMETEIWPNLFSCCHKQGIAIHIINARLSNKTMRAKPWVKSLLKMALSKASSISARSEQNARAYAQLGADEKIISTTGNLKFTSVLNNQQNIQEKNVSIDREYVLVASTHDDEEIQIYNRWEKLKRKELLIIAPRHPERAATIIKNLQCGKLSSRSKNEAITDTTQVFLLDTVGELKNYFKNAKVVVMGGSFVPIGGHNILEAARYNCAIITGPYMENFKQELALMQEKKAIIQLNAINELDAQLEHLLDNKTERNALQSNTKTLSHNVQKILDDYTTLILATI